MESSNTQNSPPSRGRGRGRGRANFFSSRRGRGRSVGGGDGNTPSEQSEPPPDNKEQNVPTVVGNAVVSNEDDGEEKEVCFICASDIVHLAIAPCNHRTCHICSLRWRALYKTNTCAHCRTPGQFVIFTDDDKNYADFIPSDIVSIDSQSGIKFTNADIAEESRLLLELNCPDESCDRKFKMPHDLKRHVTMFHKKRLCDLCLQHKRVFTHEHTLYTPDELRRHLDKGDDKPGAVDQSGFKGHPRCGFCKTHFYSNDELLTHCRDQHERCYLCNDSTPQYFMNYDALEDHFRRDHYLCLDRECLEKKFVAFGSLMDLKAHQLEQHPNGISKETRRVDLSDFELRQRYVPEGRRGGDGRANRQSHGGRGRGIEASTNITESSTSANASVNNQNRTDFPTLRAASSTSSAPIPQRSTVQSTTVTTNPPPSNVPQTKEDMARQIRHQAVVDRASKLLLGNEAKLGKFRSLISSYRSNNTSASDLVEKFNELFNTGTPELGTLIKELADLYENQQKKTALLNAWNDWRAVNEGFPSLPGSSDPATLAAAAGTHAGDGVLRLKSSTAKSGRATASRTASWGAVVAGPSASSSVRRGGPVFSGTTPWANSIRMTFAGAGGGALTSPGPSGTSSPAAFANRAAIGKQKAPTASLTDNSAFPALPSRPKKGTGLAAASGVLRISANSGSSSTNSYYRSNSNTNVAQNAWGTGASGNVNDSTSGTGEPGDEETGDFVSTGKGKKKKEKQVLMHFG